MTFITHKTLPLAVMQMMSSYNYQHWLFVALARLANGYRVAKGQLYICWFRKI